MVVSVAWITSLQRLVRDQWLGFIIVGIVLVPRLIVMLGSLMIQMLIRGAFIALVEALNQTGMMGARLFKSAYGAMEALEQQAVSYFEGLVYSMSWYWDAAAPESKDAA